MIIEREVMIPGGAGEKRAAIYQEQGAAPRAVIIYLHGGALIYGSRLDLPDTHKKALCGAGYAILAADYPLCPEARLPQIVEDVSATVDWYLGAREELFGSRPGYFLFGRSAGAYLCLLAMRREFAERPLGIISYYGYGLLCGGWYNAPSSFYCRYPMMPDSSIRKSGGRVNYELPMPLGYGTYVALRQRGEWGRYLGGGDDARYTLRGFDASCAPPLFIAHSTGDTDVPYDEYLALKTLFPNAAHYSACLPKHDFDADPDAPSTAELLAATVGFLNANTEKRVQQLNGEEPHS